MTVLRIVFSNFTWIDGLILLLGAANGWLYYKTWKLAGALNARISPRTYTPAWRDEEAEHLAKSVRPVEEQELVGLRDRTEKSYAMFLTVTSIFPLLGIFGTVWSLIPMVENMADMQQDFFAALTSTLWGLVCAILFKGMDGFLSPRITENEKGVELYLSRKPEKRPRETVRK